MTASQGLLHSLSASPRPVDSACLDTRILCPKFDFLSRMFIMSSMLIPAWGAVHGGFVVSTLTSVVFGCGFGVGVGTDTGGGGGGAGGGGGGG